MRLASPDGQLSASDVGKHREPDTHSGERRYQGHDASDQADHHTRDRAFLGAVQLADLVDYQAVHRTSQVECLMLVEVLARLPGLNAREVSDEY